MIAPQQCRRCAMERPMTDITELAQSLKAAAERATPGRNGDRIDGSGSIKYQCFGNDGSLVLQTDHKNMEYGFIGPNAEADELFFRECAPENIITLVEALEKAQQRIAELESQNDYFSSLVAMARVSADKAIRKFPQPNYVLLKVAEEAGEVVQAGVHYAENRMEWGQVEGEIVQLLAMLIRLVTEGDQINGITPPTLCSAVIKVDAD